MNNPADVSEEIAEAELPDDTETVHEVRMRSGKHNDLAPVPSQRWVPADQHAALVYVASLAPGTRPSARGGLQVVAEILTGGQCDLMTMPWATLRAQHVMALRAELAHRYAHGTANKLLSYVRGTLRAAWRLGQVDTDSYQRAVDIEPVRGESLPAGRSASQGELRAIFQVCLGDKSPLGVRDAAIVAVLYGSGLRRAEVAALDVGDYDPVAGSLRVRAGKGNKSRMAYTAAGERKLLEEWLRVRAESAGAGAERSGPLFVPVLRGGHVRIRRIDPKTVLNALQRRAKEAGVEHLTPHDMRRTYIGDLLDAQVDIATVQRLAGHANVSTTSRYDRRPEQARKKANEALHIPVD